MKINDVASDRVSQEPHIVIGGCARSGTTLLRVMLDSHRLVRCGPETRLFTPKLVDLDWLAGAYALKRDNLDVLAKRAADRVEFVNAFSMMARAKAGKHIFADKSPANVRNLNWVFTHWPNARFIHVIRDGRDVVASLKTHPRFGPGKPQPFPACVEWWVQDVMAGLSHADDPAYIGVRYEALVMNSEGAMGDVCAALGLDLDEACLRFYEIERNADWFPQNREALSPITAARIGRWVQDLTQDELAYFWREAGDVMQGLGYR